MMNKGYFYCRVLPVTVTVLFREKYPHIFSLKNGFLIRSIDAYSDIAYLCETESTVQNTTYKITA